MTAVGIHPVSRLHFFSGILSYLAAPLWMIFLATSVIAAIVNERLGRWPIASDAGAIMLWLFIETLASVLFAPIIAVYHTRFVFFVLTGHNVQWNTQQRDECGVSWTEAASQMWPMTWGGITLCVSLAIGRLEWLGWFSPFILGWALSIPIAVAMGSRWLGIRFFHAGLFHIAPERQPLSILLRHQHWIAEIEAWRREEAYEHRSLFDHLLTDDTFRKQHLAILRAAGNQSPVQQQKPEWKTRCDAPVAALAETESTRRRLLCDDGWLEALGRIDTSIYEDVPLSDAE